MGLRTMKVGTQRRFIVPPALGPPVGPSTFFSAKQCEVSRVVGGGLITGCVWLKDRDTWRVIGSSHIALRPVSLASRSLLSSPADDAGV